jgi:trehalose 6-phosphate phosphatase
MTDRRSVVDALRDRPAQSALFFDFDGTLAPIVDDPDQARPLPGVPALLGGLARSYGLVAVVSGRPARFLTRVLGRPARVALIGLYGMEEVAADGSVIESPDAERWRPVVATVTADARRTAPVGLGIEDKGLSVTLHWRADPGAEGWARQFADRVVAGQGLAAQPGRMALELRPPLSTDKGTVVEGLGRGWAVVACFGDDLGDLAAFAALDRLAAAGARVVAVAVADAESPAAVLAAADLVVDGPEGAVSLLGQLLVGPA